MKKIRAIIVEDEEASRLTLRNYLTKYCEVEILGEAAEIETGQKLIESLKPDLVFLDVEMPFGNAFDLLERLREINFETIFITAFSQYAMEALNLSASRYLLKPVSIDELVDAVNYVKERLETKDSAHSTAVLLENLNIENKQLKKIVLPMLDGFEVVTLNKIVRCQANDNFTNIHLSDGTKRTICRTLKHYEEVLTDYDFIRVHKSHIVNINSVTMYKKGKGGHVQLSDGSTVDVSPTRRDAFLKRFSS